MRVNTLTGVKHGYVIKYYRQVKTGEQARHPGRGVLAVIAREGGNLGAIDLVKASTGHVVRDLMVWLYNRDNFDGLISALEALPGVQVMRAADRVFTSHLGGKIEVGK